MRAGWAGGGPIVSFGQTDGRILAMSAAITSDERVEVEGAPTGTYQRHDINPNYLKLIEGTTYEVAGMGAEMLTVDYMTNSAILKTMANDSQNYFEVPADNVGAGKRYLSDLLFNSTLFPGGRDSVLRDKVTVSIKEEAGNLVATATGDAAIQFKNSYQPLGTEIHLQATKELVGKKLTDQEFTFELVNASNQIVQAAKNDASGQIRFDKLAYTKTGSYDYTIREKAGVDSQITYDTKSYRIHVKVSDQKGKLVASVSYEQKPKFKNIYLEEKNSSSKDAELKGLTEKKRPQKKVLPKAGEFNKTAAIVIGIGFILVGFVTLLMRKVRRNRK
ncbi:Spy0128 family protein [Lactococcus formosensis]|uniref:Spy0128 family protein n=1 Tax=Lactococcus formosensis TaxID=1281486 RepID=UPI0039F665AC